ncbi:hypothetical protein [Flavobacterium sp.]|uniref:hypothetical protein n=1 Tax=Flavobacterium sp. TaxID=239 RepID=UPI00260971A7|nr:hypothetical protein [Flavobacterium sp.]
MMYLRYLIVISFAAALTSCTNDSTNDLIAEVPADEAVLYSRDIAPIVSNSCTNCHGAVPTLGAPMPLVTADQVRNAILNQDLLGRIALPNGNDLLMPQGGPRFPDATIELFVRWQQDGFQN